MIKTEPLQLIYEYLKSKGLHVKSHPNYINRDEEYYRLEVFHDGVESGIYFGHPNSVEIVQFLVGWNKPRLAFINLTDPESFSIILNIVKGLNGGRFKARG